MYMIGNAHLDPVWLWQWRDGYHEAMATFRSALDRLNETPDFVFTCACACYYEWVEEKDPAMFEEIRRREHPLRRIPPSADAVRPAVFPEEIRKARHGGLQCGYLWS